MELRQVSAGAELGRSPERMATDATLESRRQARRSQLLPRNQDVAEAATPFLAEALSPKLARAMHSTGRCAPSRSWLPPRGVSGFLRFGRAAWPAPVSR